MSTAEDWLNDLIGGINSLQQDVKLLPGSTSATVQGIQGTPIASSAPVGPSVLQYDGTQYAPTGAPHKVIYGQNATFSDIRTAIDDAPAVQAYVNANPNCGVLRLVSVVLKSKIDFSPWAGNYNVLELQGVCVYAMNVAEIDMVGTMTIRGVGNTAGQGSTALQGPQAYLVGYNSANQGLFPEANNLVTNASTGSAYVNVYPFETGQAPLADSLIGSTFTITSSPSDTSWVGTYTAIASNGAVVYLVPQSATPDVPKQYYSADIQWNIGPRNGTTGSNYGAGPIPALAITGLKNLTGQSWKHWLSLNGASNALLGRKLHRILGIASSTMAYVNANLLNSYGGLTLPDANNTAITAYEAFDVVRLVDRCTVENLTIDFAQGPAFCIDGSMGLGGVQYCVIDKCSANGSGGFDPANAHVPVIVDDVFFFDIRNSNFSADNTNQSASMLFTSTSGMGGEYCGIGTIQNIFLTNYGVVIWSEGTLAPPTALSFIDVICDGTVSYPGQSWFSLFTLSTTVVDVTLTNCAIADSSGTVYLAEALFPAGASAQGLIVENCTTVLGPVLGAAASTDVTRHGGLVQAPNTVNWSAHAQGYADVQQIGGNDGFAPVITLPFHLPLPDLRDIGAWTPLATGGATFSNLTSDGYPLAGPDGSSGTMVRIIGAYPAGAIVKSWTQTPQVGDIIITFLRAQNTNPNYGLGFVGTSFSLIQGPSNVFFDGSTTANVSTLFYGRVFAGLQGGQWFDVVAYSKITSLSSGSSGTFSLILGGSATGDTVIDPESIAVLYIPAGMHPTLTLPEIVRMYRKVRSQITNATPGDVAVPGRVGISFGPSALNGGRVFAPKTYQTFSTSASTALSYTCPNSQAFNLRCEWVATCPSQAGYVSGGCFNLIGFADGSGNTTVSSVNTHGSNYNCGGSGAAAATPITVTHGTNAVNIQVNANSGYETDWQFTVTQANVSAIGQAVPTVTSVSQNGGTINGGTSVTVTGTHFSPSMTCTLGTLSSITPTSCVITTNAHAAGAVTWTLSNGSFTSANQTFTYLAHPATPSASPSSGPNGQAQAETFTSSGLPFGLTGVPFSITVGGLSVTGLTATSATTATGSIPAGGTPGAANIVVTVDGVSTTGTGAYTFVFYAAPTFTKMTPNIGSAAGGWAFTVTGTNLNVGGPTVTINGVACTSVVAVNATTITGVAPAFGNPNGSASAQNVVVGTFGGTASSAGVATEYFYLPSNNTFSFAHRSDVGITTNTGKTTGIADISGRGVNLSAPTGTAPNAPTGTFSTSNLPYIAFDGTDDFMSGTLAASTAMSAYSMFWVGNLVAAGSLVVPLAVTAHASTAGVSFLEYLSNFQVWSGSSQFTVATEDTSAHAFAAFTATESGLVDATSGTGGAVFSGNATDVTLGANGTQAAMFCNVNWVCDIAYEGDLSSGDRTTVMSILKTTCGTP